MEFCVLDVPLSTYIQINTAVSQKELGHRRNRSEPVAFVDPSKLAASGRLQRCANIRFSLYLSNTFISMISHSPASKSITFSLQCPATNDQIDHRSELADMRFPRIHTVEAITRI